MTNTYRLTINDQIAAKSLWDLAALCSCPNCKGCLKSCNKAREENRWGAFEGAEQLECNYECESNDYRQQVLQLWSELWCNETHIGETFTMYALKKQLNIEVQQVLNMLHAWDPNGVWDELDVLVTPQQTAKSIGVAMAELTAAHQKVPGWMHECLRLLTLFY